MLRIWLVAALVLSGCKKQTLESLLAEHEPGVRAMIANVKALAPKVKALPPMTEPKGSPIAGLVLIRRFMGTALLVYDKDLLDPENIAWAPERPGVASEYFSCANQLKQKTDPNDKYPPTLGPIESELKTCAGVKHVLVLRTQARRMAAMNGAESFAGGRVSGDVLFFTIAGEQVGGFPWVAESSDSVSVKMGASESDKQSALDFHMRDQVERAILDGLNKAHPGSAW